MPTPVQQPAAPPDSAPDIVRVPEINQPSSDDMTVDCPIEMPVQEVM